MNENWILVRYGEISLKSDWVRKKFEDKLMQNIRAGLKEENIEGKVKRGYGRIFVKTKKIEGASKVLSKIFGIVSFSPCVKLQTDFSKLTEKAAKIGKEKIQNGETFAVRARRTGNHGFSSKDIEEKAGTKINERVDTKVDLDNPDEKIYVEVRQGQTYIFTDKITGPGGLPVGTQGKVISLFRGDCPSFLATWLLMKRGCSVTLLHGDLSPYMDSKNVDKSINILKKWSYGEPLEVIKFKFGQNLFKFKEKAKEGYTCVLCKRFLVRLASKIASQRDFNAIVSGESSEYPFKVFGLENSITNLPVFRPLIGFNEDEIRKKCKEYGEEFLLKKEGCLGKDLGACKISKEKLKDLENDLNIEEMVGEKLQGIDKNENT